MVTERLPSAEASTSATTRQLSSGEFQTAMVHLYRGEVGRANTWRTRLDGTTNWAVLTTAATLSFAFSDAKTTPVMILVNSLLVFFFMFIEARRYRFYDLWRARIRLIEIEFFAEMLTPSETTNAHAWRKLLADDLQNPHFSITMWQAMGRRLRRNYMWLFGVLLISWVIKVLIHPSPATSLAEISERAAIGPLPAWVILLFGVTFNLVLVWLLWTTRDQGGDQAKRH